MTEPDAGSDVRSIRTFACPDGADYIINGTKHFISHADIADFAIVFVATGTESTPKGPKQRITCFLIDRGTPGFEIREGSRSVSHRGYQNGILHSRGNRDLLIEHPPRCLRSETARRGPSRSPSSLRTSGRAGLTR